MRRSLALLAAVSACSPAAAGDAVFNYHGPCQTTVTDEPQLVFRDGKQVIVDYGTGCNFHNLRREGITMVAEVTDCVLDYETPIPDTILTMRAYSNDRWALTIPGISDGVFVWACEKRL